MKNDDSFLFIWIVMSLFLFTCDECRGISKRQNVQNRPWYWGWGDLHWPYGISMGPILRNPYLYDVSFSRSWWAIDPVTLISDPQLDPGVSKIFNENNNYLKMQFNKLIFNIFSRRFNKNY